MSTPFDFDAEEAFRNGMTLNEIKRKEWELRQESDESTWTRMLEQLGALDVLIADPATTEADRAAAQAAHATLLARAVEARLGVAGRAVTERRAAAA